MKPLEVWMETIDQLNILLPRCSQCLDQFFHPIHGFQSKPGVGSPSIISHALCIEAIRSLPLDPTTEYTNPQYSSVFTDVFCRTPWGTGSDRQPMAYPFSVAVPAVTWLKDELANPQAVTQKMLEALEVLSKWVDDLETMRKRKPNEYEGYPFMHGMFLYRIRRAFDYLSRRWSQDFAELKGGGMTGEEFRRTELDPTILTLDKILEERLYRFISMCSAISNNEEDALQLGYLVYSLDHYTEFRNDVLVQHAIGLSLDILFREGSVPRLQLLYKDSRMLNISGIPIEVLTLLSRTRMVRRNFPRFWKSYGVGYEWIRSSQREGIFRDSNVPGWMAEPWRGVGAPEAWINAAGVEFLASYRELLHEVCAAQVLIELGATTYRPKVAWREVVDYGNFKRDLGQGFIPLVKADLATNRALRKASIILFGPPGTSKTSVARALAAELGLPFVELMPHHFVEEGTEGVVRRARRMFRQLMMLRRCLVFFDEIDELVWHRDHEKEKIGRFITTSVLPWFQQLRDTAQIVFVVATNHVEHFDPAIRRPGRFDYVLPVGPPDCESRRALWHSQFPSSEAGLVEVLEEVLSTIFYQIKVGEEMQSVSWPITIGEIKQISEAITYEVINSSIESRRQNIEVIMRRFSKRPLILPEDFVSFKEQEAEYRYPAA